MLGVNKKAAHLCFGFWAICLIVLSLIATFKMYEVHGWIVLLWPVALIVLYHVSRFVGSIILGE